MAGFEGKTGKTYLPKHLMIPLNLDDAHIREFLHNLYLQQNLRRHLRVE